MPQRQSSNDLPDSGRHTEGKRARSDRAAAPSGVLVSVAGPSLGGRPSDKQSDARGALSPCDSGAFGGATGPGPHGLVISPISAPSEPRWDVPDFAPAPNLRFPSADLVRAAAAMWPRSSRVPAHRDLDRSVVDGEWHEYYAFPEGPLPTLDIAPGLVRMRHTDYARADRRRTRDGDESPRRRQARDREYLRQMTRPMALSRVVEDFLTESDGKRGAVTGWSRDSRARLVSTILELDLASFVAQGTPCMVTLTLPGRWQEVAPTAAAAAAAFHRFDRAWRKKWGPLRCIWKREFQRRGAPHWHLWTVPPAGVQMDEFRAWLSSAWTTALQIKDPRERALSLAAGTGVDFAEGLRAADPKRLAVYFLKESLGGEGKAYQNDPPSEWEGESVGRYWGVRGLDKVVASVHVEPVDAVRIFRAMRRAREARGVTREVTVTRMSVDTATGSVRICRRKVRRRVRVRSSAGWVAVNDGAAFGEALARYASMLSAERGTPRSDPRTGGGFSGMKTAIGG